MCSEHNPMIVPLHCVQVVLLTCWLQETNFFRWGIRKKIFATQSARGLSGKVSVVNTVNLSRATMTR
jgi:hypothetical protein